MRHIRPVIPVFLFFVWVTISGVSLAKIGNEPPVVMTSSQNIERARQRVISNQHFYNEIWAKIVERAEKAYQREFVFYRGQIHSEFFRAGRADAEDIRHLVVAGLIGNNDLYLNKARHTILSWARAPKQYPFSGVNYKHSVGLVTGRVLVSLADSYAMLYKHLLPTERSEIELWFKKFVPYILRSQDTWVSGIVGHFSPPFLGEQYFNNHLGAQVMGLLAVGYATQDRQLIEYCLSSPNNPRNLSTLIEGVIIMPGDQLYKKDPTVTAAAPSPLAGEIYDRYRTTQGKGLHYSHIHLRFITLMALMAKSNQETIDFFKFRGSNGENIKLPFEFFAPFMLTQDPASRTGYYRKSKLDPHLIPLYEIAGSEYAESTEIAAVLTSDVRFVEDYQTLGWTAALLYGPD